MASTQKDGIQRIEQEFAFQQKTWRVQRAGWAILSVILIIGLLGVFGDLGPLAAGSAGEPDAMVRVEHKRFVQYLSPIDMTLYVTPPESSGDTLRLWIDRDYLDAFVLQDMTPVEDRNESASDRVIYEFPLAEPGAPIQITMNMRFTQVGAIQGRIGVEGGDTLEFSQFVYP